MIGGFYVWPSVYRVNSLCEKGEWAKSGPNLAQVSVELFWVGWTSAWLGPTAASE